MINGNQISPDVPNVASETRTAAMLRGLFGHMQYVRGLPRLLWWLRPVAFPVSPVAVRTPAGLPLTIDPRDYGQMMLYYFAYCPELLALIDDIVQPGDVCLDLGANVGLITAAMALQVGDGGKVIAVDPNPAVTNLLAYTASKYFLATVVVAQAAIAGRTGQGSWSQPQGGFSESVEVSDFRPDENFVDVITIDGLLDAFAPGCIPAFIKVDIEGSEVELTASMTHLFERGARPMLLIEFHPQKCIKRGITAEAICSILVGLGYEGWRIVPTKETYRLARTGDTMFIHENVLFVTPSHLANKSMLLKRRLAC